MKTIPITTLPVYRLDREKYYAQRDLYSEKVIFGGRNGEFNREYAKQDPQWYSNFKSHLNETYGGAWNFNEIIGHIELHIMGNQVRGTYWQDNKKRIVKTRKRQFSYITHKLSPEISFSCQASSEEIYNTILAYVENCKKHLKARYIDDSNLTNMGNFVNWSALVGAYNKRLW